MGIADNAAHREPWNKGKLVGQKAPFKLKDIWALRSGFRWKAEFASWLFSILASTALRGCDLVGLRVRDVCHGDEVGTRAIVVQHKTQRPVVDNNYLKLQLGVANRAPLLRGSGAAR